MIQMFQKYNNKKFLSKLMEDSIKLELII